MLNKTFAIILLLLTTIFTKTKAQDLQQQLQLMEDSLVVTADSMYSAMIPDERPEYTQRFVKQLVRTLKVRGSYNYPFKKLGEKINIIYPEDKSFRIFNWAIAPTDVTRRYYGAIQMNEDELKLYPLIDHSAGINKGLEDSVFSNGRWFGALYYRIIPHEVDGQTVYTLFGLNAASAVSNRKVMDPMVITSKGPVFGAPIFNVRSEQNRTQRINRFVIEYKKEVQASMNWDADMNAVYFDKLVSSVNDPNRKYTYVPSGQYDGFRWNEGYWNYIQDLIPVDPLTDGKAPAPAPVKKD